MGHVSDHMKTKMSYVSFCRKLYVKAQANFLIYHSCKKSTPFTQNVIEVVKSFHTNTLIYELNARKKNPVRYLKGEKIKKVETTRVF